MELKHSRIAGMGAYLPQRIVTNDELGAYLGVTSDWIVERCGIRERRFAAQGEGTAALGAQAIRSAAADAGWSLAEIDFILFATLSPDHFFPGSGCYTQTMLGLPHIPVMDVRNQCSGFIYSLVVANALIATGQYRRVVVVGAEVHSHCLEVPETSAEVAVLFGDGAAAVCLEASDSACILASELHVDGTGADALKMEVFDNRRRPFLTLEDIRNRRHIPVMDGIRVFRRAVAEMTATAKRLLNQTGMKLEDLDLVIAHQANLRILDMVRQRLGLAPEKMFNNIQIRGNTTAASIPLAIVEARAAGALKPGDLLLLLTFGSGFTWGGAVVRY